MEQTVEPSESRIVTKRELKPFTLLKKADLDLSVGTAEFAGVAVPNVEELEDRYLLVKVKRGGEVKREMVAPREATSLLRDSVAVGIQATPVTTVDGLLQPGDMVDVVAIGLKDRSASGTGQTPQAIAFENVMVLNVLTEAKTGDKAGGTPIGISLAIPRGRRDEFSIAAAGGRLVLTRKILVVN